MYVNNRVFDDNDADMRRQKFDRKVVGDKHLTHVDRTEDGEDNDAHINKMVNFHVECDFCAFRKGYQYLTVHFH